VAEGGDDHIVCATYTHARRHPLVLGKIAGWTPPFQLSVPQVLVLLGVFWLEMQTWHLWGALLPRSLQAVVAIGLPIGLGWIVRKARVEGRSLPRAVVGWVSLLTSPRWGKAAGRPYRLARPVALGRYRMYVAPGGD
jgi:hypothetical protein